MLCQPTKGGKYQIKKAFTPERDDRPEDVSMLSISR